jgi:Ca2+:H+ antiporter
MHPTGGMNAQDAVSCKMDEIRLYMRDTFTELLESDKHNIIEQGWQKDPSMRSSVVDRDRPSLSRGIRFTEVDIDEDTPSISLAPPSNFATLRSAAFEIRHAGAAKRRVSTLGRRLSSLGSGNTTVPRIQATLKRSASSRSSIGSQYYPTYRSEHSGMGEPLLQQEPYSPQRFSQSCYDGDLDSPLRSIPRLPHETRDYRWSTGVNSSPFLELQDQGGSDDAAHKADQPAIIDFLAEDCELGHENSRDLVSSARGLRIPSSPSSLHGRASVLMGHSNPTKTRSNMDISRAASSNPEGGYSSHIEYGSGGQNGVSEDDEERTSEFGDIAGLKELLLQWINLLLIVLPVAFGPFEFSPTVTFFINLVGLIPLSQLLADSTEQVAIGLNSAALGALLNATLGNATEMIVTVTSLQAGLYEVVKSAMLGSILSNLLAVLGVTIMAGAFKYSQVVFSIHEPLFSVSLLLLGSMTFSLPTLFFYSENTDEGTAVAISRSVSLISAVTYGAYVGIQMASTNEEEEEVEPMVSMKVALLLLVATTYLIGMVSDALVDSISGLIATTPMSARFVGVVLLPLAGNAQGALQGIVLARRGGTSIAIALAMSGCTQVALLVLPFAVLVGWVIGKPMDLKFDQIEIFVIILSILVAFSIVVDGRAGWQHGLLLCSTYCTLTVLFWSM